MSLTAAVCATALLALLSVVQLGAAAGAAWGHLLWGGKHRVLPPRLRIASGGAVVLYAGFAAVLLGRAGALTIPSGVAAIGAWVLLAYFALGVLANLASRSRAERLTMTPACALLAGATAVVIFAD
jgi:hypothetical protein